MMSRNYGNEVIGFHKQQQFYAEDTSGSGGNIDGQFEQPEVLERTNRHGFTVYTRHYSQASIDHERTVTL